MVYFDTSALVKLVFDEPGSNLVGELWDRASSVVSGQLVYPEARAAAAAAHRNGRLDAGQLRAAVRTIDEIYKELTKVRVDAPLAKAAGELAERRALRGYDAVHLASALSINDPDVVLATWDRALADAAGQEGLAVAPGQPDRA
ncbi:type II toxin-antitoxin system VapC family toxin [Conexibacter sp. CPCC 205706]|uniref:type II toxin-antitoxin system VapC family toxin n=1 Tax=Conexibacter sp. CPCC 205706 TaxID=3064572 RepID=UPI00351C1964